MMKKALLDNLSESMLIDFHTHLLGRAESLIEVMDRNNIESAVVIPFDTYGLYDLRGFKSVAGMNEKPAEYVNTVLKNLKFINEKFLEEAGKYDRLIPAPWISPWCPDLEGVIDKAGIIKFIPVLDNATPDYYSLIEDYVSYAVNNGKAVMIHSGWGASVKPVVELAGKHSHGTFIVAHKKEDDDSYDEELFKGMKACNNLYCETSYCPHSKRISQYVKAGLGKRLLFGSDYRTLDDEQSIRGYLAMLNEADITLEQKMDITYNNAKTLLEKLIKPF